MKVLMIGSDRSVFDAGSPTRRRMKAYAEALGELHELTVTDRVMDREFSDGPLTIHPVRVPRWLRVHTLARRARALINEQGFAIVSAQDPFEYGRAALRAVEGTTAKLHVQVHTDFLSPWFVRSGNWRSPQVAMPFLNRIRRRYADEVLPRADGIRVVSERVKRSLVARYGSRIPEPSVIPIAIDPSVPPAVRLPAHAFTFALISVGRLEPEKRLEDVLAALALVVPKYPAVGLFIVGEGRERGKLERMVRRLGLGGHVVFLGERAEAWGLMQSAQAFIQASAYEGYGRTLVEAALAKIPIITTDVGIVGEVFKGYESVLSVPVADPTALSLAVVGLLEDQGARVQLPIAAEEAARTHLASIGDLSIRIKEDFARLK